MFPHHNCNFTMSEEAFLLSSLHEVVKVWTRGSGQASFNLNVNNGEADLQLNFHLGHPNDEHIRHVIQPSHHPQEEKLPQKKRKKSANRLKRDRERAAQHQAQLRHLESAALVSCQTVKSDQNLILPNSILEGNLVPFKPSKMEPRRETTAASSSEASNTPSQHTHPHPHYQHLGSLHHHLLSGPEDMWMFLLQRNNFLLKQLSQNFPHHQMLFQQLPMQLQLLAQHQPHQEQIQESK